jgi:hypothetical protein
LEIGVLFVRHHGVCTFTAIGFPAELRSYVWARLPQGEGLSQRNRQRGRATYGGNPETEQQARQLEAGLVQLSAHLLDLPPQVLKLRVEFRTHPGQLLLHPRIDVRMAELVPLSEIVPVPEVHGVQPVYEESSYNSGTIGGERHHFHPDSVVTLAPWYRRA